MFSLKVGEIVCPQCKYNENVLEDSEIANKQSANNKHCPNCQSILEYCPGFNTPPDSNHTYKKY